MQRSFPLAPMTSDIIAVTIMVLLLPFGLAFALVGVRLGLPPFVRSLLVAAIVLTVLSTVVVWVWSRPTGFAVAPGELEIVWPMRAKTIPLSGLRAVELIDRKDFQRNYGRTVRVGVGGLFGGFGTAIASTETFYLYVSRTDRYVLLRPAVGNAWLITPADPEDFVRAVQRAST